MQYIFHFITRYTLNTFWHTKTLRDILLILAISCISLTDLNADFKNLPKVQEFENVVCYDDAVNQLFYGQNYEASELETVGLQLEKAYTVISSKKKWFVKIIKENCFKCNDLSLDSEWLLKNDEEKINLVKTVNAELVLPDKGAVFMFENYKHIIISYPWAPGKTIREIYKDCFKYNRNLDTLQMLFYRYGQVWANLNLDHNNPSDDINELLNRTPLLSLDDRHDANENFFERNKRIYFLDLANVDNVQKSDTVIKSLMLFSQLLCSMHDTYLTARDKKKMIKYFSTKEYITIPAHYFIAGYISELTLFNPIVIEEMLQIAFNTVFLYYCNKGMSYYCDLKGSLYVLPRNKGLPYK